MSNENTLYLEEIIDNIKEAFNSLSGNEIAEVHNNICSKKVDYEGDSEWKFQEED